jgi:hypothetical protein
VRLRQAETLNRIYAEATSRKGREGREGIGETDASRGTQTLTIGWGISKPILSIPLRPWRTLREALQIELNGYS